MKARKRRIAVVKAVMLAFALVTVNAVPVLADEVIGQSIEENTESVIVEAALSERQENPEGTTGIEYAEVPENAAAEENSEVPEIAEAEENSEAPENTETEESTEVPASIEKAEGTDTSVPAANPITEVTGWNKHEPNNELVISQDQLGGSIIAGKMTANQPVVIWTHTPLSEEGRKLVWDSLKGNPGVGNPKNVVFIDGSTASLYGMTVDSEKGIVRFDKTSKWSLLYAGEYKTAGPSVDPGQENLPGTGEKPGKDEESGTCEESGTGENPGTDTEPGTEPGPILDGGPDTEPKTDTIPDMEVPDPGTDVETEPEIKQEPEKLPETEDKHDTEVKPETEPEAKPEIKPEAGSETKPEVKPEAGSEIKPEVKPEAEPETKPEDKPETKPEVKPENVQNSLRPSGTSSDSSGSSGSGSGRSRSYGSNSEGPGTVHALDAQPDTGLLSEVMGRQLDETPKTGVPAEFCILMVISVLSLIALGITLIFEKKSEKGKNE